MQTSLMMYSNRHK